MYQQLFRIHFNQTLPESWLTITRAACTCCFLPLYSALSRCFPVIVDTNKRPGTHLLGTKFGQWSSQNSCCQCKPTESFRTNQFWWFTNGDWWLVWRRSRGQRNDSSLVRWFQGWRECYHPRGQLWPLPGLTWDSFVRRRARKWMKVVAWLFDGVHAGLSLLAIFCMLLLRPACFALKQFVKEGGNLDVNEYSGNMSRVGNADVCSREDVRRSVALSLWFVSGIACWSAFLHSLIPVRFSWGYSFSCPYQQIEVTTEYTVYCSDSCHSQVEGSCKFPAFDKLNNHCMVRRMGANRRNRYTFCYFLRLF